MALLSDQDREEIKKRLQALEEPVKLIFFTQEIECNTCQGASHSASHNIIARSAARSAHQILKEVAELSDKVELVVHNFVLDKEMAERYGIDKIPAIVVEGANDYGVRFFGAPVGYRE